MARSGSHSESREHVAFPSAFFARGPRRASPSLLGRSFIAARSSSVNPLAALPVTVALLRTSVCPSLAHGVSS